MTQSEELLKKLYDFYKGRYNGQALEDKFNSAVADLVETNDIERGTYVTFCIENDIEPITKGKNLKHIKTIVIPEIVVALTGNNEIEYFKKDLTLNEFSDKFFNVYENTVRVHVYKT